MVEWLNKLSQNNQTKCYELEHEQLIELILYIASQEKLIKELKEDVSNLSYR